MVSVSACFNRLAPTQTLKEVTPFYRHGNRGTKPPSHCLWPHSHDVKEVGEGLVRPT